ncbi:hypothetical protein PLESTB_000510800 [Pleodorina starrii]|uniref:Histone deacetylase domain-containing protein n=1 Tax=Pleodorina starrii TaxID=330485 RepID=A0A9W6BGR9_9CHLO|nr:hypothetical protein PLESTB_000510800 [Pleodorina starrii]
MLHCPTKARAVAAFAAPPIHVNFKRLGGLPAARVLLPAAYVTSVSQAGRLPHFRAHAAAGFQATDGLSSESAVDEGDDDEGDDEFIPPPLPTSALELLSGVLTHLAATNFGESTSNANAAAEAALATSPNGVAYQPLRFCVNCCRPLSTPGAVCASCGHDPRRNAEILGDPTAWVDAYAAQLKRQQDHHHHHQDQHQPQAAGIESPGEAPGASSPPATRAGPTADVLLAADARTLLHRSSLPPYPGRPERLQAVMSRLHSAGLLERCRLLACRPATDSELLAVHSRELMEAVRGLMGGGGGGGGGGGAEAARCCGGCGGSSGGSGSAGQQSPLCADTLFNAHTGTAALLAAGAAAELGIALASGAARSGLAVMRPPGAQAGIDVARGGCYFNNVAVAAAAALSSGQGIQRVMIVDWDVHHGRGTQEIFAKDPRVMVVSMHRYDSDTYPGSGAVEEVGDGEAEGTNLNIAFGTSGGAGGGGGLVDGDLLSTVLHVVLPVAYQFRPQLVLVAAGFGALKGDPIGGCSCSPAVFAHLTHLLSGVAPRGGLGLVLEGGYNLSATSAAVEGCLRVLLGEAPPPLPGSWGTTSEGWVAIMNAMQIHSHFWSSLHPLSFHGWTGAIANQQRQLQQQQEREEMEEQARQQHQQQLQQQLLQHQNGAQLGAAAAAAAAGGGWAPSGLRDDDLDEDDDGVLDGDGDGDGDGLSAEELARVAAALARARETWGAVGGDGGGGELAAAHDQAAAELADPRDITPVELLDVFLGTGGGSGSGGEDSGGEDGGVRGKMVIG